DLWVDDFPAAHDRVMSLGAKVLKPAAGVESPDNFQVYADPAGHPFCLCWVQRRERPEGARTDLRSGAGVSASGLQDLGDRGCRREPRRPVWGEARFRLADDPCRLAE